MRGPSGPGLVLALYAGILAHAGAARAAGDEEALGTGRTPPRLAFLEGEVSLFRAGAEEPARVNVALAPGDALSAGLGANLELEVGPRAFVRAGPRTRLGLVRHDPDALELKLTAGTLFLDLRSPAAGPLVEIETPHAALGVERNGSYRIAVDGETTAFTRRSGGRAVVTPAGGAAVALEASAQLVVTGVGAAVLDSRAAPELDAWERWNLARTDHLLAAPSPGRWMWEPGFGWSWVDDAPWGWAPFHSGRWMRLSGPRAWCPGSPVPPPLYAPAHLARDRFERARRALELRGALPEPRVVRPPHLADPGAVRTRGPFGGRSGPGRGVPRPAPPGIAR